MIQTVSWYIEIMFANIAFASGELETGVTTLMNKIFEYLVQPFLGFLFMLALVMFMYGVFRFVGTSDKSSDDAQKGRQHMLWGVIGMFVMMSVFGIIRVILQTLGMS